MRIEKFVYLLTLSALLVGSAHASTSSTVPVQKPVVKPAPTAHPASTMTKEQLLQDIGECLVGVNVSMSIGSGLGNGPADPTSVLGQFADQVHQTISDYPDAKHIMMGDFNDLRGECDPKGNFYLGLNPIEDSADYDGGIDTEFHYTFNFDGNHLGTLEAWDTWSYTGDACNEPYSGCGTNRNRDITFTPTSQAVVVQATCNPQQTDALGQPMTRTIKSVVLPKVSSQNIIHFKNGSAKTALAIDWNGYITCMQQKLQQK